MNIGSIFLTLLADGAQLTPQVEAEAAKAGDAGAKTLGQRLGASVKTAGMKAFGLAATAAFGLASKGALELEEVQLRIQAETGATADEAKAMGATINRVAGDNQMSLNDVAEAAIRVRRDLGATGEEADALTESFARFARVTRQDAATAVEDFDDILDAYGLTAADAARVQDQLLASVQEFGGSVVQRQKDLANLAPQLRALNMDVDDGVSLLNLFAASGLDASKATFALNTAVQKLKPGQTFDDLVREISAIEDPTRRAQRAVEVFGARGGVALANALRPGMNGLEDFAVTAEESAGTVAEAADAIDSKWFGLPKLFSQAGAALRGFGAEAGPVLTALAALTSLASTLGLSDVFKGAWSKVAGSAAVKGAAAAAGAVGGTVYAAAAGAAEKLVGAIAGAWGKIPGSGMLTSAIGKAGAAIGGALATSVVAALAAGIAVFFAGIEISKWIKDQSGMTEEEWQDQVYGNYARMGGRDLPPEVKAASASITRNIGHSLRDGIIAAGPEMAGAVDMSAGLMIGAAQQAGQAAGEALPVAYANGILDKQQAPLNALDQLKDLMANVLSRPKEIARLMGQLTSQALADGLNHKRPAVRAEARRVQADAEQRLALLISRGGKVGEDAAAELARKLKSKNPQVRASAQRVKDIVGGKLDEVVTMSGNRGEDAAQAFARRMKAAMAMGDFTINAQVGFTIPGRAKGGPVKAGNLYAVNEDTPRTEFFAPEVDGRILTNAQAVRATGSGGDGGATTYQIPVTVQGALPVRTARDIVTEIRRVGEQGLLPARDLSPKYHRREVRA